MAIAKPLSVVAALAALAAAGLMVFSCLNQNFVAVEFGTVDACNIDESPIATVGVYQSTFDDSCLEGTEFESTYDVLGGKIESPTTEFFPLFPAQTGYGGLVPGVPEFTTCEEFYNSDELTSAAASAAVQSAVVPGVEASFGASLAEFKGTVDLIFGGLPVGLSAFVNSKFPAGYADTVTALQPAATGAVGVLTTYNSILGFCGSFSGVTYDETDAFGTTVDCTNFCAVPDVTDPGVGLTVPQQFSAERAQTILCDAGVGNGNQSVVSVLTTTLAFCDTEGNFTNLPACGGIVGATVELITASGTTVDAETVQGLLGVIALHIPTGLVGGADTLQTATLSGVVGGVLTLTGDADEDFSGLKNALTLLNAAALSAGVTDFAVPANLLSLCSESSVANCTAGAISVDSSVALDSFFPACVVAAAAEDFNETSIAGNSSCSFGELLIALTETDETFLQGLVDGILGNTTGIDLTDIVDAVPALAAPVEQCSLASLTLAQCGDTITYGTFTAEESGGFPSSWGTGFYGLCNGLVFQNSPVTCSATPFPADSFRSFVFAAFTATQQAVSNLPGLIAATNATEFPDQYADLVDQLAEAVATLPALTPVNVLVNVICVSVDNLEECLSTGIPAFLEQENADAFGLAVVAQFESGVYAQVGVNSTSLDQRIADCEDDEKDLEIFGQAQGMAAAATAAACLVALLSIVNIVKTGPKLSVVAGLLAVVAGAVLIGALLLVRTAPVYSLISDGDEAEVPGDLIYKASFVQLYALVACIVSVVAGVLLLVTACLSRGGSDEETDGKVATASY